MTKGKYYVYCVKVSDEIVYIGKGSKDRYKHALSGISHNKGLNEIYFKHQLGLGDEPTIHIIEYFDTSDKAFVVESFLIKSLKPSCNVRGCEDKNFSRGIATMSDKNNKIMDMEDVDIIYLGFKLQVDELQQTVKRLTSQLQRSKAHLSNYKRLYKIRKHENENRIKFMEDKCRELQVEKQIVDMRLDNVDKYITTMTDKEKVFYLKDKGWRIVDIVKYFSDEGVQGFSLSTVKRMLKNEK